jgi:putative nucleotidyltransferase with HDIG domain
VYRLAVVGDARTRPEELARQMAGLCQLDFYSLPSAFETVPKNPTLIDLDLDNHAGLLSLKDWLSRKPKDAKIIFVTDKASRLHEARAYALGATAIVHRPISGRAILAKLGDDDATLASLPSTSGDEFTPGIAAATDTLRHIFSAACSGAPIHLHDVQNVSGAVVDQLEAQGLSSWIETVRMHHSQTYQHCLLVTGVAAAFGEQIGVGRKDRERLSFAGMLHDIGKARIPLAILEKPGRLDENETAAMRKHPELGLEALGADCAIPTEMLDIVVHHHELLDGSGYPHHLQGGEIPDLVRMMTIADIFGALIERRSYKAPLSADAAYQILLDMGPKLDRDLVRAFKVVSQVAAA